MDKRSSDILLEDLRIAIRYKNVREAERLARELERCVKVDSYNWNIHGGQRRLANHKVKETLRLFKSVKCINDN